MQVQKHRNGANLSPGYPDLGSPSHTLRSAWVIYLSPRSASTAVMSADGKLFDLLAKSLVAAVAVM